jgi:hypothetical protein
VIPRTFPYITIGQSYAATGYFYGYSHWAFSNYIRRLINTAAGTINANTFLTVAPGDMLQLHNRAIGGSSILAAFAGSTGYWVEDDLVTNGPLLNDALTAIAGIASAGLQMPLPMLYSHGEQEASLIVSEAQSHDAQTAIEDVLWPAIRAACDSSGTNPTGMPVFVDMLGHRFDGDEMGEYWMRDRLIESVQAGYRTYYGVEKYALQLDMTTHPVKAAQGYMQQGAHAARKVGAWLLNPAATVGSPGMRGPYISGATRSGQDVEVVITVPSGGTLIKPSEPDFFGLFDASENRLEITAFNWSGDNVTLTASGGVPAKLRYPCSTGKSVVDTSKIIRLEDPSDWVYPGEIGFPLESMKTRAL